MDDESLNNPLNSSKEYIIGQIGILFKHKWASTELGWTSRSFEDHLIDGQQLFRNNSILFIKFNLQLKNLLKLIHDIKSNYFLRYFHKK